MIVEYHRPDQLDDAIALLLREDPIYVPIGGGTCLDRQSPEPICVVDLQALGLDKIAAQGSLIELGACLTLQKLLVEIEVGSINNLENLQRVIRHEASYNLRQVGTLAGTLMSADGRSPFTAAMLALDCSMTLEPGSEQISLGDLLPLRRERLPHRLITTISIPINARLAYEYVARSPSDLPIVAVAVALWPSGRTRVVLGGYGEAPLLVFDANSTAGAEIAAASAYKHAGDQWASAEYRQEISGVLTKRTVDSLIERASSR